MALFVNQSVYGAFAKETTYGDDSGLTVTGQIGLIRDIKPKMSNSLNAVYGIGLGRLPQQVIAGQFECGIGLDFDVQNGAFLEHLLGSVSGAGTAGDPYVYASATAAVPSYTWECAFNTLTTARTLRFLGSMAKSGSIKLNEKETVTASMEYISKTMKKGSTYQAITASTDEAYVFQYGNFESPASTTIGEVINAEFKVDNGTENMYAVGGRFPTGVTKAQSVTGTAKVRIIDGYWMDMLLTGATNASAPIATTPAAIATMKLNLTNGSRYIYVNLANIYINSLDPGITRGGVAEATVNFTAKSITATEVV